MTTPLTPSMQDYQRYVLVCTGSRCTSAGEGRALYEALKTKLKVLSANNPQFSDKRSQVHCFGVCRSGPLHCVQPDGVWYYAVDSVKLDSIIRQHLIAGEPVAEWVFHQGPICERRAFQTNNGQE